LLQAARVRTERDRARLHRPNLFIGFIGYLLWFLLNPYPINGIREPK
jgi:hypothetical protein